MNSWFRSNVADTGGTLAVSNGTAVLSSSTIYSQSNGGNPYVHHGSGMLTIVNSIVWGSATNPTPLETEQPGEPGRQVLDRTVRDLRRSGRQPEVGSAPHPQRSGASARARFAQHRRGKRGALPLDTLDFDDDADVTEPLPLDLLGGARVRGSAVDMGAYEH